MKGRHPGTKYNPKYWASRIISAATKAPTYRTSSSNGIPVRDTYLINQDNHQPDHEKELINAIWETVKPGDDVVLLGANTGASTVHAVNATHRQGHVHAVEAADGLIHYLVETLELSNVKEYVTVYHAVIGDPVDVYGTHEKSGEISLPSLPSHDVLIMDIEGGEKQVLEELDYYSQVNPERIVVETHKMYDSGIEVVSDLLLEAGYSVTAVKENDAKGVDVLTAYREDRVGGER